MAGDDTGARPDEDHPLSVGESLGLIESQQREVHRRLGVNAALFYGPWGAAYLLGFGSVFLTYPSAVPLRLPGGVAAVITGVLFAAAVVLSVVNGTRGPRPLPDGRGDVWLELDPGLQCPGCGQHRGNPAGTARRCRDAAVVGKRPGSGRGALPGRWGAVAGPVLVRPGGVDAGDR